MASSSSKARKEEAELRDIAKRSRLARNEVKARERREKIRAARLAKADEENKTVSVDEQSQSQSQRKDVKPRGALILPSEIAEMHRRHGGAGPVIAGSAIHVNASQTLNSNSMPNASQRDTNLNKKSNKKKAATSLATKSRASDTKDARKGAVGSSTSSTVSNRTALLLAHANESTAALAGKTVQEPSYHFEIHFKKKEVMVDVNLHHVPHQKINVSETTPHVLVVDTTAHTKRYRLTLPMPAGLRIDVAQSSFEFANGVLQCRLPVAEGEIPTSLQSEWEAMHARVQTQKKLRFRVGQDGALTVRSRSAVLTQQRARLESTSKTAAKTMSSKLANATQDTNDAHTVAANEEERIQAADSNTRAASKQSRRSGNATSAATAMKITNAAQATNKAADTKASTSTTQDVKPVSSSSPLTEFVKRARGSDTKQAMARVPRPEDRVDVHKAEHARTLQLAQQAGRHIQASLASRVQMAEDVQRRREARLRVRSTRKEQRDSKKQSAFARVLEEQKKSLVARVTQQSAAAVAVQQRRAARERGGAAPKSVRFAE